MRILTLVTACIVATSAYAADAPLEIKVSALDAPASLGNAPFSLVHGSNGETYLTWSGQQQRLEITSFDPAASAWRRGSRGPELFSPDAPSLSASATGRLLAAWGLTGGLKPANPRAPANAQSLTPVAYGVYVESRDGGLSWSGSTRFTAEFGRVGAVSAAMMNEKSAVIAWRDLTVNPATPNQTRIYAQFIVPGEPEDPAEVAPRPARQIAVGEGLGNPTAFGFADGSALIAYTVDGVLNLARFENGRWAAARSDLLPPRALSGETYAIVANGPRLTVLRTNSRAYVNVAFSTDAGHRFDALATTEPTFMWPISDMNAAILRDGSVILVLSDAKGTTVRRINAGGTISGSTPLFDQSVRNYPFAVQLAVVNDDGRSATRLIAATNGPDRAPIFKLLTLPEPEAVTAADADCGCGPSPEELVGYPIRVRILSVDTAKKTVSVDQPGVAGVFPADTREFKISDDLAKTLRPGQQALGRIEERDGAWWLYALRILML